jgi:hypothetical protein
MISKEDVQAVAKDLKLQINEEQIKKALIVYEEMEKYPTDLWFEIVEQIFYDLDFFPKKDKKNGISKN